MHYHITNSQNTTKTKKIIVDNRKILYEWILIDVTVSLDKNTVKWEGQLKIEKYQDLAGKIEELYDATTARLFLVLGTRESPKTMQDT